jgi:hypothetical protein
MITKMAIGTLRRTLARSHRNAVSPHIYPGRTLEEGGGDQREGKKKSCCFKIREIIIICGCLPYYSAQYNCPAGKISFFPFV